MPQFDVRISGEDLDRAMAALNGAGINTAGTTDAYWTEGGAAPEKLSGLLAVVDADDAEKARARVSDQLPAEGGYELTVLTAD